MRPAASPSNKYGPIRPRVKEQEVTGVTINAAGLLPGAEGVTWLILKTPLEISSAQLDTFAKPYSHNARPIQPLGSRVVEVSQ